MQNSKLQVGDLAPNFKRTDIAGRSFSLRDYSNSYVFIAFLRYAGCPWCNLAIHRLSIEKNLFDQNNCKIVAFIQSAEEDINFSIIDRHKTTPEFPIIADPDMNIYQKYYVRPSIIGGLSHHLRNIPAWLNSVYKEGNKQTSVDGEYFLAPAAILIAPGEQKVLRADYAADFYEHDAFMNVYNSITEHKIVR